MKHFGLIKIGVVTVALFLWALSDTQARNAPKPDYSAPAEDKIVGYIEDFYYQRNGEPMPGGTFYTGADYGSELVVSSNGSDLMLRIEGGAVPLMCGPLFVKQCTIENLEEPAPMLSIKAWKQGIENPDPIYEKPGDNCYKIESGLDGEKWTAHKLPCELVEEERLVK